MDLCALPDGRVVTIRPIQADDTERLQLSHARLSPESRYRRFLSAKPHLTAADARYLVDIDGCDHYALVATAAEPGGTRSSPWPASSASPRIAASAEFAIVVGDDWQRQGLGGELLGRLADAAVTRGVDRFRATMLADNVADPPPGRRPRRARSSTRDRSGERGRGRVRRCPPDGDLARPRGLR